MGHTPGPWTIDDAGPDSGNLIRGEVYGPRRQLIAELPCPHANRDNHVGPKNWLGNARLIAAAPDMLLACIRCERELARLAQELDSSEQKTLDMLRDAIAKASGAGTG